MTSGSLCLQVRIYLILSWKVSYFLLEIFFFHMKVVMGTPRLWLYLATFLGLSVCLITVEHLTGHHWRLF